MEISPNIQFKLDRAQPLNQAELSMVIKAWTIRLANLEEKIEELSKNRSETNRRTRKNVSSDSV
jgi:hypothetical protein